VTPAQRSIALQAPSAGSQVCPGWQDTPSHFPAARSFGGRVSVAVVLSPRSSDAVTVTVHGSDGPGIEKRAVVSPHGCAGSKASPVQELVQA
jgi:hypothetical protein